MVSSIIVALIYINNHNQGEKRKWLNEQIQQNYIEHGIFPMQEALSAYGINSTFSVNDVRISAVRAIKLGRGENLLKLKIDEIRQRPMVADLIQRKFELAMEGLSYLRRFGIIIYGSIIRTLQHYSEILSDILTYEIIRPQIKEIGIDEWARSVGVVAKMIEITQLYLQTRLDNLKDYIWQKDFKNYTEFLNVLQEEKYKKFVSDLEQYNKLLTHFMDSIKGKGKLEDKKESSLALSGWLNKNTKLNPFD